MNFLFIYRSKRVFILFNICILLGIIYIFYKEYKKSNNFIKNIESFNSSDNESLSHNSELLKIDLNKNTKIIEKNNIFSLLLDSNNLGNEVILYTIKDRTDIEKEYLYLAKNLEDNFAKDSEVKMFQFRNYARLYHYSKAICNLKNIQNQLYNQYINIKNDIIPDNIKNNLPIRYYIDDTINFINYLWYYNKESNIYKNKQNDDNTFFTDLYNSYSSLSINKLLQSRDVNINNTISQNSNNQEILANNTIECSDSSDDEEYYSMEDTNTNQINNNIINA